MKAAATLTARLPELDGGISGSYVGRSSSKVSLIIFSGMEADRNVKVVGGDVAVL